MISLACVDVLAGKAPLNTTVTIKGWVRTRRDSKAGISFVNVSDGSCLHPGAGRGARHSAKLRGGRAPLTAGCSVEATGLIVPSPAKGQRFEMQASAIKVLGWVDDPDSYPIQPKPHTLEFLRDVAHLRPRTNVIGAVTRVRHTIARAIHRFFDERGFFWVNTPIITASDTEGAGALFRRIDAGSREPPAHDRTGESTSVHDFFGRETFLTVSGQLNVEAYCLRAVTRLHLRSDLPRRELEHERHLAEFWMVEPEIAFADLHDDANLAEALLKHVFRAVLEESPDDMSFFEERIEKA